MTCVHAKMHVGMHSASALTLPGKPWRGRQRQSGQQNATSKGSLKILKDLFFDRFQYNFYASIVNHKATFWIPFVDAFQRQNASTALQKKHVWITALGPGGPDSHHAISMAMRRVPEVKSKPQACVLSNFSDVSRGWLPITPCTLAMFAMNLKCYLSSAQPGRKRGCKDR